MEKTHPDSGPSGSNTVQIHNTIQDGDRHIDIEDIYKLTPHVTISFTDTFKESSAITGFSFMGKINGAIYKYTHFVLYAVLSLIIGPFMVFVWAITFALTHIFIIWLVQPSIKAYFIWLRICNLLYEPTIRLFFDPLFRSGALVYSSIRGQFRMNSSDLVLNVKTTQV